MTVTTKLTKITGAFGGFDVHTYVQADEFSYVEKYNVTTKEKVFHALGGLIVNADHANECHAAAAELCKTTRKSYAYKKAVKNAKI